MGMFLPKRCDRKKISIMFDRILLKCRLIIIFRFVLMAQKNNNNSICYVVYF